MNEHIAEFKVRRGFETIAPVYEIIQGRGFIGGSYAAFMVAMHDTPILPNDVDIFAVSPEAAEAIRDDLQDSLNLRWTDETDIASTLKPHLLGKPKFRMDVQVVRPHPDWKDFPLDIVTSFDMDICRAVLVNDCTALADENVGDLQGKFLRINNPIRSMHRAMKYYARGVQFSDWELLKLFRAWDEISPERKQELTDFYNPDNYVVDHYDWVDDDDWFRGE